MGLMDFRARLEEAAVRVRLPVPQELIDKGPSECWEIARPDQGTKWLNLNFLGESVDCARDSEGFLTLLAPYVTDGSYIEMDTDHGDWRWYFLDGEVHKVRPSTKWEEPRAGELAGLEIDPMPPSLFWLIVGGIGWGTRTTDYAEISGRLRSALTPSQGRAFTKAFWSIKRELSSHLFDLVRDVSDDSFGDLVSHIIGLGKEEFDAVREFPDLAQRRIDAPYESRRGFVESFAYAIPDVADWDQKGAKP